MKRVVFTLALVITITTLPCLPGAAAKELDPQPFKTKEQCLNCHGKESFSIERDGSVIPLYVDAKLYSQSVHGSYSCLACHQFRGEHEYGRALTDKVSAKCANCHTGTAFAFHRGVHAAAGSRQQPNCVDCHGGHSIAAIDHPSSPVAAANLSRTCGEGCHDTARSQFEESFHGKAAALGAADAADCTTCHGSHQILGRNNIMSGTHADKKPALCRRCHAGSLLGAGTVEHYTMAPEGFGMPMYFTKKVFMWLILIVVGIFLLHIELVLFHRLRHRLPNLQYSLPGEKKHKH